MDRVTAHEKRYEGEGTHMNVRYGLIGFGRWGGQHADAIRRTDSAELVAVAASSPETAARAEKELGVSTYTNYHELLAREDVDVVDIVLPNHLHHEVAMASLNAGKHILLEKPMALTVAHCEEIIAAAAVGGLKVHVGHELRFSPLWTAPKVFVEEGKLGRLKSAQVHLSRHPFRPGASGWRTDLDRVGSWILEEPVHFYDLVTWYFQGEEVPVSVYAVGNSRSEDLERSRLYENMVTNITFSRGGYAVVSQSLAAYEHHLTAEFVGTEGVLKVWWSGATDRDERPTYGLEYFDGKTKIDVPVEGVPGELSELDDQLAHFTHVVATDAHPKVTGEDGLWPVKLCEAAQESILQGDVVRF